MRQGRIRHGGAQRRTTYGAYATEGCSFCVVPLTHASMRALGACVPMRQTRSLTHASNARTSYVMRQGRIRHGGAQRRMTYDAYAMEGSSFCVVPLTHASMSALGACVPMHQTRSLMHASNAQQNKFPPWRMRHTPHAVERPRLMCPHASNVSSLRGVWRMYVIRHAPTAHTPWSELVPGEAPSLYMSYFMRQGHSFHCAFDACVNHVPRRCYLMHLTYCTCVKTLEN